MKTQLDIAGLTEEQIALLQSLINAFQSKNQLEQITTADGGDEKKGDHQFI